MRRMIVLLLICVLPIQLGWAAFADAVDHISGGHSHDVVAHAHDPHDAAKASQQDASLTLHTDCGACNFYHLVALTSLDVDSAWPVDAALEFSARASGRLAIANSVRPERPKWIALV
jgi:hypothetical protein